MGIHFDPDEIFEMAQQIERNGRDFYLKAAAFFRNSEAGSLLTALAAMEEKHLKTFTEMRERLKAGESSMVLDPGGEAALYLQAMAEGHVFNVKKVPSNIPGGKESPEEVMMIALGLEKDSIVFYLGLKEMVRQGKEKIDAIIREEMLHITELSSELDKIIKGLHEKTRAGADALKSARGTWLDL